MQFAGLLLCYFAEFRKYNDRKFSFMPYKVLIARYPINSSKQWRSEKEDLT